jgi:hypothetical protein
MSPIEIAIKYYDDYPFLKTRKKIYFFLANSRLMCQKIIASNLFTVFIVIIIIMNS